MNKIVSFGDSFIFGSELQQEVHGAWPAIVAKRMNCEYETLSVPGCGNDGITKQIYTYFANNSAENTIAIINWTWISRWDFYVSKNSCDFFDINQIDEQTYNQVAGTEWPQYSQFLKGTYTVNKKIEKELLDLCKSYIGASDGKWLTLGPTCSPKKLNWLDHNVSNLLIDLYKEFTGNSVLWNKFRNLQSILSAQYFLETYNIKNIQTYMDHELFSNAYTELSPDYISILQNLIFSKLRLFYKDMNFLEWARYNNFKITESPGDHPLEDAHNAAADLWYDEYKTMLSCKI